MGGVHSSVLSKNLLTRRRALSQTSMFLPRTAEVSDEVVVILRQETGTIFGVRAVGVQFLCQYLATMCVRGLTHSNAGVPF